MKRFVALTIAIIMVLAVTLSVSVCASENPSPTSQQYYKITWGTEGDGTANGTTNKIDKNSDGTVTFSADQGQGYFTRWIITGDYEIVSGGIDQTTITIRPLSDVDAIASFSEDEDYLTMTAVPDPASLGEASVDKAKVLKGSNEQVTFTATEKNGGTFINWTLACDYDIVSGSLTSKTLTIIPYTDVHATAHFNIAGTTNPDQGSTSPKTADPLTFVIPIMALMLGAAVVSVMKLKKD